MTLESIASKGSKEVIDQAKNLSETTVRKAWSILDAASEKRPPSEYLSQAGIKSIQGLSS